MALTLTPGQLTRRAQFYYQLGQLASAGLGLINALEMQLKSPPSHSYVKPIAEMLGQLQHGATFSDALKSLGTWTPSFDIALLEAAEHSGRLDAVFKLLGDYYTDRAQMLRTMISDMMYPTFVLHFAVFLLPFPALFASGNIPAYLAKTFGVLIPIYAILFVMVFAGQSRRGATWRSNLERILRPVPILGAARQYLALARLSTALEALISAGVNIIPAWEMAAAASGSPALHRTVSSWKTRLYAGQTPAEAVRLSNSQFPDLFANLYHTGEVTGQLDDTLRRLYVYYLEEGRRRLRALAQWLPRFFYLMIALMIAYRVITFYLGYFQQIQNAGGF